ncbi:hypothetical protein [uncultured Clostridium sp.]|jgi:hypothetical protein|uniref:hypothetical protein n=1 Tax=uncultured Clostridium sp. TaxID=59620 RepID=UPI0025F6FFD7|nr:hypothetical protein [uncultured Clostridium sp.]
MKLREVTQERKDYYENKVVLTLNNYDKMITEVDNKLFRYGAIHHDFCVGKYSLGYAKEKKEDIKVEIKNINVTTLDNIVAELKNIREDYIKEIVPETSTTDLVELNLIEKELKVMSDSELLEYYKENYLDKNIIRLVQVEYKARNGFKDSNKARLELPKYDVKDTFITKIDTEIKRVVGLRQVVSNMCSFVGEVSATGSPVPKLIPWNTIFENVEKRNLEKIVKVSLKDFV